MPRHSGLIHFQSMINDPFCVVGLASREHLRSAGGYKIDPIIESIAASRPPARGRTHSCIVINDEQRGSAPCGLHSFASALVGKVPVLRRWLGFLHFGCIRRRPDGSGANSMLGPVRVVD